ncbi:MFS transporter [Saccharopolyspora phatthalungensis]|uniref:MFS family permease n=1 Tax=Saccharopolyspora phatthalungensis TaxID=664693 RepID=A0A840QC17_9PSEU|nr:MFS transporter [Saccharopolyspora phatthalungensis]MBB5157320.1 MFS family permease [Saccharopolyspora phatthalungensis]
MSELPSAPPSSPPTAAASTPPDRRRTIGVAFASWACASIEWYDFFIYGTAAALVFPQLFFPVTDSLTGTLLSFAAFGVAFVARPFGGALFGHLGDTFGRKKSLITALVAMGVATTLIGLLPTYQVVGAAAPVLLVLLRFLQGIAVGGQQGGVILLATENAPARRRGFYSSFAAAGAPGGVLLANGAFLLVTTMMPHEAFVTWGWRIPFVASFVLIVFAVGIQLRLEETAEFRATEKKTDRSRSPLFLAIRRHPRQILLAAGCYVAINITYYVFITFIVAYTTNKAILGMAESAVLSAVMIASAVELFALPLAGLLSDRFGRRTVFASGAVLLGLFCFAFWPLVDTGSVTLLTLALVVGLGLVHSLMYGPHGALFSEAFTTEVRYSSLSLGIQLANVLGGAFAPFIATALLAGFGTSTSIAIYMAIGCAIGAISTTALRPVAPAH